MTEAPMTPPGEPTAAELHATDADVKSAADWCNECVMHEPSKRLACIAYLAGVLAERERQKAKASKGGKARAKSMTKRERSQAARKAANARWKAA